MVVIFVPSDVVGSYAGWPQRERALAVPLLAVPVERKMPPARFTAPIAARRPHRGRPARLRPHHGRARIDAIEVVLPGAANFQR